MTLYTETGPGAVMGLRREGLDVRRGGGATSLRVAMLNLMPDKRQAERQMARLLVRSGADVSLSLFLAPGHRPRGESPSLPRAPLPRVAAHRVRVLRRVDRDRHAA